MRVIKLADMTVLYSLEPDLLAEEFRGVLIASMLGERRPVDDLRRLHRMRATLTS